jgi:hypothetical protein
VLASRFPIPIWLFEVKWDIKTVPRVVTDAMKQLEARIARAADMQQVSVN